MKIYPSRHKIKRVEDANIDKDVSVPLAYLDEDNISYDIKSTPTADFSVSENITLLPNMELIDENIQIFDEFGEPILKSETLINRDDNGKYVYYPNTMREFDPLKFLYEIIVKRNLSYSISNKYNMSIGIMDDPKKLDFANRLSKILMTPAEKGFISDNIMFNNNETKLESYLNVNEKSDFVFIESDDGETYNYEVEDLYEDWFVTGVKQRVVYESYLRNNTNIWIVSDNHNTYPMTIGLGNDVKLKSPKLFSDTYTIKNYYNVSDPKFANAKVHNLFTNDVCPIVLIEHENQGFVIYSSSEIFEENNIDYFKNLVYEVLLYVYCNTYKKSEPQSECITYKVPEYEVRGTSLERKMSYTTRRTVNEIVGMKGSDYYISQVNIVDNNDTLAVPDVDLVSTVDHIKCRLTSDKSKLIFELDQSLKDSSVYQEPEKPTGWKSVLYNNKVYYLEQFHQLIETNLQDPRKNKLFLIEEDLDLVVRIYPFKSSKHGLNINKDLRLVIPYIKTTVNGRETIKNESYAIYINKASNSLEYLFESDYKEAEDRVLVTIITIVKSYSDQFLTDMRLRGGGLPEDMPDNFNLLDIGHIYGRPYRQANTLVITLPKKYEPYKKEILEVINKYKVAEDYPILFFEDDEMDGER